MGHSLPSDRTPCRGLCPRSSAVEPPRWSSPLRWSSSSRPRKRRQGGDTTRQVDSAPAPGSASGCGSGNEMMWSPWAVVPGDGDGRHPTHGRRWSPGRGHRRRKQYDVPESGGHPPAPARRSCLRISQNPVRQGVLGRVVRPGGHEGHGQAGPRPGRRAVDRSLPAHPEQAIVPHLTCEFPACTRPSRGCNLDHIIPWPFRPTATSNLTPLCRLHHRIKTTGGWTYRRLTPAPFEWTSPHARASGVTLSLGRPLAAPAQPRMTRGACRRPSRSRVLPPWSGGSTCQQSCDPPRRRRSERCRVASRRERSRVGALEPTRTDTSSGPDLGSRRVR